MLNRRYLRIKVYQSLYAFWQSDSNSAARIEKELFLSIERTFDLFVSLLLTFGEFRRLAEQRIEDRKLKHLPSASDLSASRKFVDGPLITGIASSALLEAEANKRRLGWMGQMEMFQRILKQFESDPAYQAYMAEPTLDPKREQQLLQHLFLEHTAHFEELHDIYEARSIYWLEDMDLACALVKRVLEGSRDAAAFDLAVVDVLRAPQEEHDFVSTLFRKCIEQGPEHEESIGEKAANWEADRIALSDMILMKMALTEVREFPEIPVKVTLNEYIEVAKAYSTPKSKNFINGILDKLFAEMKADGRIHKVGRGLLES
ncbi:MAG: transcription antitermination protein NusB [Flavobacteriales bacterium]|nr:transcription antitermination protein NusB [Flavobacteriales bacterium]MBP6697867.1 transcription antitermination protein NusB [Flavobacteriales bacterium]